MMMTPLWALARLDLKRRWRSLTVLTLLTAAALATVMISGAGAHRAATAPDRLESRTLPADAWVLPNTPGFDWKPIEKLPYVQVVNKLVIIDSMAFGGADASIPRDTIGYFPADDNIFNTIEKPVILEGRNLDPTRADEALVTPNFLKKHHKRVGDTVQLVLPGRDQVTLLPDAGKLTGPRIAMKIVGVLRTGWYFDRPDYAVGQLIPSPAVVAKYPQNVIGDGGGQTSNGTNAMLRLKHRQADLPQLRKDTARITGRSDIDIWDLRERDRIGRRSISFESTALAGFSLAALIATLLLVGQALIRHVSLNNDELSTARAIGMTPRQVMGGAALAPVLAVATGSALAFGAAVIGSRWFPTGQASLIEPDPGVDIDWLVLGGLFAGTVFLAGVVSALSARTALRAARRQAGRRQSTIARLAAAFSLPVSVQVGTRFALEPGRGRSSVPVRPALVGAVIGVIGATGVLVFDHGLGDAMDHPERLGQTYDALSNVGYLGEDYDPDNELKKIFESLPYVRSVVSRRVDIANAPAGAGSLSLFTYEPTPEPVVMNRGRLPERDDEVVLGPRTAGQLHVRVGGHVRLEGSKAAQDFKIVGIGLLPIDGLNAHDGGGWITAPAFDRIFRSFTFRSLFISATKDARGPDLIARLITDINKQMPGIIDDGLEITAPDTTGVQKTLRSSRVLPRILGVFLALLGLGALGHALALAVRRRSAELAVLRALGMTPRQTRGAIGVQSLVVAAIGVVFGIPLGIAVGRTVWRAATDLWSLHYLAPSGTEALVVLAGSVLVLGALLALLPAGRAANTPIVEALKAE
jgi:hypothetical protein